MNWALYIIIRILLRSRYIGGKHIPEERLLKKVLRNITNDERKTFQREYQTMVNEGFIFRMKKRTGRGSEWHICLNPNRTPELKMKINEEEGDYGKNW